VHVLIDFSSFPMLHIVKYKE